MSTYLPPAAVVANPAAAPAAVDACPELPPAALGDGKKSKGVL
jgi:hypothetical protein